MLTRPCHSYVYHPLDKLYIVLITNKHSNIMEDLETLRLLSKLVPDICGGTSYDAVQAHVFDVLFACDEVITSGGYKEDITLRQVRTNMEMNSHDERLAQLIRQSKINEAKETAHAKAKELAEQKRLMARTGLAPDNAMPVRLLVVSARCSMYIYSVSVLTLVVHVLAACVACDRATPQGRDPPGGRTTPQRTFRPLVGYCCCCGCLAAARSTALTPPLTFPCAFHTALPPHRLLLNRRAVPSAA